jgi:hypothetical protein
MNILKTLGLSLILPIKINSATTSDINVNGTPLTFNNVVVNSTKDQVVDIYINATIHGIIKGLDEAIDEDAQFNINRGNGINALTKSQIIRSLKESGIEEKDCHCEKTVLQDDNRKTIVKVDMKYKDLTRTDVVTVERTGNSWKITKVEISFN